ncbi:uncharacterized protein PHACADRAFT_94041, partial [Phanerochaete carnosa HHB-10118-sp]
PFDIAKKLKRSWVEVQKIKSRWRAQKRKEGLTTTRPAVNLRPKEEQDVEAPASRGRRSIRNRRDNATDNDKETKKLTLRELQVLAYSKSSLHTYRSGASRRQDDTRGRGRGLQRDWRGRGQPDMRLRMNAMLEKIKKDFA